LWSWGRFNRTKTMRFDKDTQFCTFKSTHQYLFLISDQIYTLVFTRSRILFKTFIFLYYINRFRPHCERRGKMSYFLFFILNEFEIYCSRTWMIVYLRY
jgi:hypothetical protein